MTENFGYGRSTNPADRLPKCGLRTANFEKQVLPTFSNLVDPEYSRFGDGNKGRCGGKEAQSTLLRRYKQVNLHCLGSDYEPNRTHGHEDTGRKHGSDG